MGKLQLLVALFLVVFSNPMQAQRFNWRVYNKAEDGLRESEVTSVTVSPRGSVWIRHGGLDIASRLDGYEVVSIPAPFGVNARVHESVSGQIWSLYEQGLQEFIEGAWVRHPLKEIRAEIQANILRQIRPIPIYPWARDRVLVLLTDQLVEYHAASRTLLVIRELKQTKQEKFLDLLVARNREVWITGSHGLVHGVPPPGGGWTQTRWEEHLLNPEWQLQDLQRPTEDEKGGIITVADSNLTRSRQVVSFYQEQWEKEPWEKEFAGEKIRQAWRGLDGVLWAQSFTALFSVKTRPHPSREKESSFGHFDAAPEPKGIFWLATHEGLYRYAPLTWRTPVDSDELNNVVRGAVEDSQGRSWFVTPNALLQLETNLWKTIRFPEELELDLNASQSLLLLPDGDLAIAAADRVFLFSTVNQTFAPLRHPQGRSLKMLGQNKDGLCFSTLNPGLVKQPKAYLEIFNGHTWKTLLELPDDLNPGQLNLAFFSTDGNLWLGTSSALHLFREQKWVTFGDGDSYFPEGAFCLLEVENGKLWCGGRDRISEFDGKKWTAVGPSLDRVNAMIKARDGSVWIGANAGLYRFWNRSWVFNGIPEGLPSSTVYTLLLDRRGDLWAGTTRGISRYHPEADVDPPRTYVSSLDNPKAEFEQEQVSIVCSGRDKWKFTPAERLLYSYRVDSREWVSFAPGNVITLRGLNSGKHWVEVRSMDRNWNIDLQPAAFEFKVVLPWYREKRLLVILAGGIIAALFFALLAFNRHRQLLRSYSQIEGIVALRTQQLEQANQELLHSQKMKALGTLAAGIAHDFNNILSIIKGNAQIIEKHLQDTEKIHTRVERIKMVVDQGAGIVKAMLGFSRTSDQKNEKFDLVAAMEETVRLLSERFREEIRIEVVSDRIEPISGVKGLLQQMLLNLIFNAADAVEKGGQVTLRAGTVERLPDHLIVSPKASDRFVFMAVQDTGTGVPAEVLPRIFEPFFTTKALSSRRGTGLGLSMVYEFAKEMEYGLHVTSTPGKGSTFTIFIPASAPEPVANQT